MVRDNWSILKDKIRYVDDTSVLTGRPVKSAVASLAVLDLLKAHGYTTGLPTPPSSKKVKPVVTVDGKGIR